MVSRLEVMITFYGPVDLCMDLCMDSRFFGPFICKQSFSLLRQICLKYSLKILWRTSHGGATSHAEAVV